MEFSSLFLYAVSMASLFACYAVAHSWAKSGFFYCAVLEILAMLEALSVELHFIAVPVFVLCVVYLMCG